MPERTPLGRIANSITVKISLIILIIETVLLCFMGVYYYNRFSGEIDSRTAEKLALPGTLMSQMALNFETVLDFSALEELVEEHVADAFIIRKSGEIFYSADPERVGRHYTDFFDPAESLRLSDDISQDRISRHSSGADGRFLSILSPLAVKGNLLGFLYVKIRADRIEARKRAIVYLFLVGSMLTILLTTLVEALWVHRLFVPRIKETVSSLRQVEEGNFAARVSHAGSPDQIGRLIDSVNSMISQVDVHTRNLQALAEAGEELAEARSHKETYEILLRIVEERYSVETKELCRLKGSANEAGPHCREFRRLDPTEQRLVSSGEIVILTKQSAGDDATSADGSGKKKALLFIPVIGPEAVTEVICLKIYFQDEHSLRSNDIFLRTLSRLMANSVRRTEALTSLGHAEKQYRDLFTNAVEGIFTSSADGRPETVNPALARMMGFDSPEDMIAGVVDLGTQIYVNPEDRVELFARIDAEGEARDFQFQVRRKSGEIFWASISAYALRNSRGELTGLSGSIVDISERKRIAEAEEERRLAEAAHEAKSELLAVLEVKNQALQEALDDLQRTQAKLVQSEKMAVIGTMAGGVAHDLNNILSGIVSYPDLLLMQLPPHSGLRESIEVIKESGTRAAAIVSDLLTMARGVAYNTVIFNVNNLVEKYLQSPEFNQLSLRFPGVQVDTRLAPDLLYTKCSPVHIEKVIMNLATNAVEAVRSDGSVVLSTENIAVEQGDGLARTLAPGAYIAIRVFDSGPGIPEEDLERVFEPFYTRKVLGRSGTGLGLSVVWNTAQEHQGFVTAESAEGGTTFTVYLPSSREFEETRKSEAPSLDVLKASGTVLVVDDEPRLREIAKKMLTALGYGVDTVASGEEAVEYLKTGKVDLVLLDMIMDPGINGYETYREIAAIHPGQSAVITSGYSEHQDLSKAVDLGVNSFLKKPYTMEQLGLAVKEAIKPPP